jgi:hypothetical protein
MMQANKAEKIFKEFEAVIRSLEKDYGVVLPDKSFTAHLHHNKELNGEVTGRIKLAFANLGRFTPAAEAAFVKEYKASVASSGSAGVAEKSKQFQFIMNKVRIQEEDCIQEFKVFYSRLVNDKILGEPA